MLISWGRRGAMSRLALDMGRAAIEEPQLHVTISVSRANERFADYAEFGPQLFPVEAFRGTAGSAALWRLPALRRALKARIEADRIETVVTLMPHVWGPLVSPVLRQSRVRTYTVVHDAVPHPGDPTGFVHRWCHQDLPFDDRIVTLSRSVTDRLIAERGIPPTKILTLFHPTFQARTEAGRSAVLPDSGPFRLLFLGRILPYKGLPLLLDALEILQGEGLPVTLTLAGDGDIEAVRPQLRRLGVNVINRWLTDAELDGLAASHHALALSHIEASQSGGAALALGHRLPIIASPVGGIVEQIEDGETGILAQAVDARAFSDATKRLMSNGALYRRIVKRPSSADASNSIRTFIQRLAADIAMTEARQGDARTLSRLAT